MFIIETSTWTLLITQELSWVLRSTYENSEASRRPLEHSWKWCHGTMSIPECSWVLISHAHESTWALTRAHECLWHYGIILRRIHGLSWLLMAAYGWFHAKPLGKNFTVKKKVFLIFNQLHISKNVQSDHSFQYFWNKWVNLAKLSFLKVLTCFWQIYQYFFIQMTYWQSYLTQQHVWTHFQYF